MNLWERLLESRFFWFGVGWASNAVFVWIVAQLVGVSR